MPVKVFARRDTENRPDPPGHSFEVLGSIEFIRRMWRPYHKQKALYVIAANLRGPSADLVIVTQYGLGVVEFKHYEGRIERVGNAWFANGTRMKAGSQSSDGSTKYKNPHEQVRDYAEQIREKLIHPTRRPEWLPGSSRAWDVIKIQTAVCFTHPFADISALAADVLRDHARLPIWEEFSVLTLDKVPEWVASLRFGLSKDRAGNYEPELMTATQILNIATYLLRAVEWTEITDQMPVGEPYAFLTLIKSGVPIGHPYGLREDENLIGRDPKACVIEMPEGLKGIVSRRHARLIRSIEGVYLEDLNSTHGTFVDGRKVTKPTLLRPGQTISLGDPTSPERNCQLAFTSDLNDPAVTTSVPRPSSGN